MEISKRKTFDKNAKKDRIFPFFNSFKQKKTFWNRENVIFDLISKDFSPEENVFF